jgi:hypothetical protein
VIILIFLKTWTHLDNFEENCLKLAKWAVSFREIGFFASKRDFAKRRVCFTGNPTIATKIGGDTDCKISADTLYCVYFKKLVATSLI